MDQRRSYRGAKFGPEPLPSLAQRLLKTYGSFLPGDISVRVDFPRSAFTDETHPDTAIAHSTLMHELHHHNLIVGTTWGLSHLRYTRSWSNLGAMLLAEKIIPAFRDRGELVPYPLQRFCALNPSHPVAEHVLEVMRPFSQYTECLYFDLGLVPSLTVDDGIISLPTLSVSENVSVPFGVWWLLESAARIEDRLRRNDFTENLWPFMPEYDFIWQWAQAIGLASPFYVLAAIDIAMNPVLPYDEGSPALPVSERLAHVRFELITRVLYEWQEKRLLPQPPDIGTDGWVDRGRLDEFVVELQSRICEVTGWATPAQAFRYLTDTTGWNDYGITLEHIAAVLALRETSPSAFAVQTLSRGFQDFFQKFPPRFVVFNDGWFSTIKDPLEGTLENLRVLRNAVTEQIICESGNDVFVCPFCLKKIRSASDHYDACSAKIVWPLLAERATFSIEELVPVAEWHVG